MENKFPKFLILAMLILFYACGPTSSNKSMELDNNKLYSNQSLSIDTFSTFPPEIDGCSCYFSSDSVQFNKAVYIYISDYGQTSFLKINNVLTKFTQTASKEVDSTTTIRKMKSNNYELTIEEKYLKQSGEETHLNMGTIKITNKNGKTTIKTFFGECGC